MNPSTTDPYGTGADVHFSDPVDWRREPLAADDADDDEERPTPPDVIAILGFDPAAEAEPAGKG